jgi:membrane protease YdiL (CAAX protease family)
LHAASKPIEPHPVLEGEERNPAAWIALFILFGLLVFLALVGYLGASSKLEDRLGEAETTITARVSGKAVSELFSAVPPPDGAAKIDVPPEVLKAKGKNLEAAELALAVSYENTGRTDRSQAAVVRKLGAPDFASVYDAKKITRQGARDLATKLPKSPAVNRLAQVHAYERAGVAQPYLLVQTPAKARLQLATYALIVFVMGLGTLLWGGYFVSRYLGKLRPEGHPALPMSDAMSDRFAMRALQIMGGFVVLEIGGALLYQRKFFGEAVAELAATVASVAMLVALVALPVGGKRISLRQIGWRKEHIGRDILWGLSAAIANAPLLVVLALVGEAIFSWLPNHPHPISVELTNNRNLATFFAVSIAASVCAPLFEESVFRGILFPALTARFRSAVVGVLLSSFFFAAMHPTGPPQWFPLAGIGAVSAGLSYQTRSLTASFTMHAAHNLATLLIMLCLS